MLPDELDFTNSLILQRSLAHFVPLISIKVKAVNGRIQFLKRNDLFVFFNELSTTCAKGTKQLIGEKCQITYSPFR